MEVIKLVPADTKTQRGWFIVRKSGRARVMMHCPGCGILNVIVKTAIAVNGIARMGCRTQGGCAWHGEVLLKDFNIEMLEDR